MTADAAALTETQQDILDLAENNPEMSNADIAAEVDKHVALVRDVLAEHAGADEADDEDERDDGFSEAEVDILETAASDPTATNADIAVEVGKHVALVRDFRSDTQTAILEAVARNPDATNADIAEQVGSHVALVRDTRNEYEAELADLDVDVAEPSTDEATAASAGDDEGLSSGQVIAILVGLLVLIGVAAVAL